MTVLGQSQKKKKGSVHGKNAWGMDIICMHAYGV